MNLNMKLSEAFAVIAVLNPQTVANTELFSNVIDMGKFRQVMGVAMLGNMAAETIDFRVLTCDSDGNNAVELKDCDQLAAHASNNDNKQLAINVRAEDLIASGKTHVKFGLVTGNTTGGPAAVCVIGEPRDGLGSAQDLASVVAIEH